MAGHPGMGVQRSGLVTALGIINIVLGALGILCGLAFMFLFTMVAGMLGGAVKEAGNKATDPEIARQHAEAASGLMGMLAGFGAVVGVCFALIAIVYLLAGIGVLKRRQWGRIISLILGVLAGLGTLLAIYGLVQGGGGLVNVIINGLYTFFVFFVLLGGNRAAEFS